MKLAKTILILTALARLLAFKPFYYEDASVEETGIVEVELGIFSYERENGEDLLKAPFLKLNMGIFRNLTLEMEFKFFHQEGTHRLSEVNLFAKGIFLRWKGVVLGYQGGFFLPAFPLEKMGGQGILMAGIKWHSSVFHFNLGWVREKNGHGEYILSTIWMGPLSKGFRPVGELTYCGKQLSLLLGFMLEKTWGGLGFGVRKGISPSLFSVVLGVSRKFP